MKRQRKLSKPVLLTALVVVVLGVGGVFAYNHFADNDSDKTAEKTDVKPRNTVDYGPPTEEEQQAGDNQKEKNAKEEQNQSQTPPTTAAITVVDASQYGNTIEVRAFISNIIEDGGTCKVTFTQNGASVTKSNPSFKDATTTQCGAINIPRSEFPASGKWNASITYNSSTASGQAGANITLK